MAEKTLPASIKVAHCIEYEEYTGPKEDLIAAGLVTLDMFPPPGRVGISYLNGVEVRRRCKVDETFRRVEVFTGGTVRVCHGVTREEIARRREKDREESRAYAATRWVEHKAREAAQEAADRKKKADLARRNLKSVLRTEIEYRRSMVMAAREWVAAMLHLDQEQRGAVTWHAFSLTDEGVEDILMSVDAVAEAIMRAEVLFDADKHAKIVKGYEDEIRAADPGFYAALDKLTTPNPSILQGEAQ